MGALSEQPLAAESMQSVLFAEAAPAITSEYVFDEEFPSDLPVTYDWMLQPASQRALHRALRWLGLTLAVVALAACSYSMYRLPSLIIPIGGGLAIVGMIAAAFKLS